MRLRICVVCASNGKRLTNLVIFSEEGAEFKSESELAGGMTESVLDYRGG